MPCSARFTLFVSLTTIAMIGVVAACSHAAEQSRRKAVLSAEQAGPDFAVQGEYTGTIDHEDQGPEKIGVQIIARGDGRFDGVGFPGGLPGDGWNGKDKIRGEGETQDGVTRLEAKDRDDWFGVIEDGQLSVQDAAGNSVGRLKKVVRKSPTLGKKPPEDAVVLFDGRSADNFIGGRMTDDGLLMPGVTSRQKFQSFRLHLEFQLSFMPFARGQARSNSGCYMQGRYEVQILDSFGLEGRNNECGGIYGVRDPDINMCFPPLSWQTYDVDFTAAKYDDDGNKVANARMTVRHNGVLIHEDVEVPHATRAGRVKEGPEPGPIYIQDHGNPLRFRNIWVVETKR